MAIKHLTDMIGIIQNVTANGKLKWSTDPSGGFLTHVNEYIINVFDRVEIGENGFGIRVIDKQGNVVDYADANAFGDPKLNDILGDIHENARRSALNIDNVLATIFSDLSSL